MNKMDVDSEEVIKVIFPSGIPEEAFESTIELYNYLSNLGTFKVDQLKKEQSRIEDETKDIIERTEDLAISNYKTFIHTAEKSRSIFKEFQYTEMQVSSLLQKLPNFCIGCEQFEKKSAKIHESRRQNTITLKKNAQLLEILELPQLMERCIREGRYEEALELAGYVQKMGENQGHIPAIVKIVAAVDALWHTMLVQLVAQLRTDLQLPKCLQIVGFLRRMQAFENNELKIKFLQARDSWLASSLEIIPDHDAQQHLMKTIEVTRINLFNIITQYRAIFPEDDITATYTKYFQTVSCDGRRLFQSWLHQKIDDFLLTLETDLTRGISSIDTVLGQCMYFGLSFSRVGADFRALMVPIFVSVIRKNFENLIDNVNQRFKQALEKYTLINKITIYKRKIGGGVEDSVVETVKDFMSPPETLLDFIPLAVLCNGYLNTFNELRFCAPIAISNEVTRCLQLSLEFVSRRIASFYRQEQQAFTTNERECFKKLCSSFAYDLIPYMQRCIHAIFPKEMIINYLGISLLTLAEEKITFLQQNTILEHLKDLLPSQPDKCGFVEQQEI